MNYELGWMDTSTQIPVPIADHINRKYLDIQYYGDDPLQKLDLYLPNNVQGSYPVILHVHGGGFNHCDKSDWHLYPMFFALNEGFAVAAINYRLAPASPFPSAIYDVKSAARWITDNANKYGLDSENIFLWGTSAGGNLISNVANTWYDNNFGEPVRGELRAAAALCPVINFPEAIAEANKKAEMIKKITDDLNGMELEGYITPDIDNLIKASADTYINSKTPAYYLQHGTGDSMVPVSQSTSYAEKLKKVIGEENVILDLLQGEDHAGPETAYMEEKHNLPIFKFFKKYIR
ncbi:MAG: alpha/beta hydrolase [Anaerocolumna sp.]